MINWFDMPAEGLSNGGQFEVKELEVTENGTYEEKGEMYNKVVVNVEGGGGSSDFSTATVTVINNDNTFPCVLEASILQEESGSGGLHVDDSTVIQGNAGFGTNIHRVVLYKGGAFAVFLDPDGVETVGFDIAGDIKERGNSYFITGDCTVTIQSV